MKLIYKESGKEVKIGDTVTLKDGELVEITYFREPHKPSSEGKVVLNHNREYYVSVIGAKWVEREDQTMRSTKYEREVEVTVWRTERLHGYVMLTPTQLQEVEEDDSMLLQYIADQEVDMEESYGGTEEVEAWEVID